MPHRCYQCATHDDRCSFDDGLRLRVPGRFRGPPGNVNGGFATGMLACPALHAAARDGMEQPVVSRITARLRAGVPVDRDLSVAAVAIDSGRYGVTVRDGDADIIAATVELGPAGQDSPVGEERDDIARDVAMLAGVEVPEVEPFFVQTGDHPIPGCFSCGPEHAAGLQIYPRFVEDGMTCAPWGPHPPVTQFDNGDGTLSQAVLTAAIDCSSGICMPIDMQRELLERDEFFLLGTMDVRYLRPAPMEAAHRVAAKALRRDGRKFFGLSVLANDAGLAYAAAESTWIIANVSRTAAFGG